MNTTTSSEVINANAAIQRTTASLNRNIDLEKYYELCKQEIDKDGVLTSGEKSLAIKLINIFYDYDKVSYNKGTKRVCENCNEECLATSYCEICIRNYLKKSFSEWSSGNEEIDDLIRKCQMNSVAPDRIIEWIPYNNLRNIKYKTKGGFSEIYTADWIGGSYDKWDSEKRELIRLGNHEIILKNFKSVNRNWIEEV